VLQILFMCRTGILCLLLAWQCSSYAAEPAPTPSHVVGLQVDLVLRGGNLTAVVGDEELTLQNLKPGSSPVRLGGVNFSSASDGGIQYSSGFQISIGSPDIKGWRVQVAQNVSVNIKLDFQGGGVAVSSPLGAGGAAFLICDDGGQVQLKPGAKGQVDFFKNGCYMFKGSGNLVAINADGQYFNFLIPGTTMTGGPMQLQKDGGGKEYWERPSPTASLKLSGTPGKDLKIALEGGVNYNPQDNHSTISIGSTGAKIDFSANPDGSLKFNVGKGKFEIKMDGVPGLVVTATSGQSASMTWDKERKLADIKNLSPEAIQVTTPGRSFAVVGSSVEFQFSMVAQGIFSATSSGGDVQIYNAEGNPVANVQTGGLMMPTKQLLVGLTSGEGIRMRLNWDNGQPLQASSSLAVAQLQPGTEKIITFGSDGKAKITYSAGGFMTLEALRSSFQLVIDALHGMTIHVVEGDSVSLTLDLKKGTFTVKASQDNINDVAVETENGYSPVLQAARALNFNIGEDGGLLASSAGQVLFFAGGPTDPITGGLIPPTPATQVTDGLVPPPQPVVSVIR